MTSRPEFGSGLVSLGRRWGFRPSPLPSRQQIHQLLTTAIDHGVRIFDSAGVAGHVANANLRWRTFQYPDFNGIERSTCPRRALYVNLTGGLLSFWLARLPSALGGSRFCALLTGYCQIDANG